ncbi:MAG TPA: protein-glutamate O-methyltransferase CheR [bacterium]|nr:protein-glutamate O-methyltransferase CheR [bacterium]HPN31220.1 protein-glutamate O-methyltransferase CheR [bacterium]
MNEFIKKISDIITEQTGIDIGFNRYHILNYYLQNRLKNLRLKNDRDFIHLLLDKTTGELNKLIGTITVNETFFFRHYDQFILFRDLLTEQAKNKPFEPIYIWSAGCASGAEPYSIAIIAKEIKDLYGADIKILATDIDEEALENAKSGIFSERAITAEMPEYFRILYFNKLKFNDYEIKAEAAKLVSFMHHNIWKDVMPSNMDYIFCRNVLFYFKESIQTKSQLKLYNSLKPGGHLFLSPAESLLDYSEYFIEIRSEAGIKCYKKWTTDRRINENKNELPRSVIDQRKPLDSYPPPKVSLNGNNTIIVKGIIKNKARINILAEELFFALGQISASSEKGEDLFYNLNFNEVRWLSNDAIKRIKGIINSVKSKKLKLNNLICSNQKLNEWLNISGVSALAFQRNSENYIKAEPEKNFNPIIIKPIDAIFPYVEQKKESPKPNFNVNNSFTDFQKENTIAQEKSVYKNDYFSTGVFFNKQPETIKPNGKFKVKYVSMSKDNEVEHYKNALLESLSSNKELEIDLTELTEINPKFFIVLKRFLNVMTEDHKILFKVGKNAELLNWLKINNVDCRFYK